MKKTDWYSGDQKPVRRGWYEVWEDDVGVVGKLYFECGYWYWVGGEPANVSDWPGFKWRGMTEKAQ